MLLLELAVQSVRGFSPSVRIALKPGFVVLKSPAEAPAPVAGLISALCFPDGKGSDAALLAAGQKTGKAGISFQANDNAVWRLVRELGGQGSLHKLNATTRQYEVVTKDATEMQSTLRAQVGLPPRATFDAIFTLTPGQFPTRRASMKVERQKKKAGMDAAVEESKLKGLKQELAKAKEAGELQYKLDGLTSDGYRLESKQKTLDDKQAELAAARAELADAPTPEKLGAPHDIVQRVARYPDEKKKSAEQVRRVMEERDEAGYGAGAGRVPAVWSDSRFLLSVLAGVGMVVLGGLSEGALHYAALLAIAPFTFAALLALRYIEELQAQARKGSKGDIYSLRIKKLQEEFALYEQQVNSAMEAVGAATRDEFFGAMEKPQTLQTRVAELEVQYAELQVDPENQDLPARIAAVRAEAEALNQRLLEEGGGSGYARSEIEIQRDIERAEQVLERAKNPEDAFGLATSPTEHHEDPTPALMLLACDLFALDMAGMWAQLKDRTVQYLTALADRRYHAAEVDRDGHAFVHAPGRKVPVTELAGRDLDLWYLSLRLTLVEKFSARSRVPVVVEDGLNGIVDDPKLPLLNRMLKHLGTLTQVVHVVGQRRDSQADEGQTFSV
ncbi:MAG: chromosome segregation protein SMC [Archangiaceae bacterium]|nr:chromosome segregation protein SMC [Archangiaceae bacterium]